MIFWQNRGLEIYFDWHEADFQKSTKKYQLEHSACHAKVLK